MTTAAVPDRAHTTRGIAAVAATACTFALGSAASVSARQFYAELALPAFAPPGWLFGPVWTLLFVLMAVAAWLCRSDRTVIRLFAVQLVLNALWSWLFFAWRMGEAASVEVVLLWLAIAVTMLRMRRVRPASWVLMLPYLAWVSFATVLTITVWRMNPTLL